MATTTTESRPKERTESAINLRSFLTVTAILLALILVCGLLSHFIPQGSFERDADGNILPDSYQQGEVKGIALWRVLTAPVRVFASADAATIIVISLFLLVMSGVFNLLNQTGGIKVLIVHIMRRLRDRGGPVVCVTILLFMLFGSLFGMFEELVTLLPLIIMFVVSMNMDTMTGLGACLLAACFGFSAAITNPFSVGTASQLAGIDVSDGVWLRLVFFAIVYVALCVFMLRHLHKIEQDPTVSPTYASDVKMRANLAGEMEDMPADQQRIFRVYSIFFIVQCVLLLAIACIREISGYAIPILAVSFLVGGLTAGQLVCRRFRQVLSYFLKGAVSMLPAVAMIAMASSVKLIIDESHILDTLMHSALQLLIGRDKFITILLIYGLILFLQLFIGSASAKIFLIMPIVLPITNALGISPMLVILTYCMADGFTDVILPTNPVLLISLSMANVSYGKWLKWTWKLQLCLFVISLLVLLFCVGIGY